jgi:hypothetical protein
MDTASLNVKRFLEALRDGRTALAEVRELWISNASIAKRSSINHPSISFQSRRPFTNWRKMVSGREFNGCICLNISVNKQPNWPIPCEAETIEFEINLLWDENKWYIKTEVSDKFNDGRRLIRSFPERQTESLDDCLQQLKLALNDLATCEDLLTQD